MPIYEYVCGRCGHAFEHLARTLADGARACPKCGAARPRKAFSTFAARSASPASKACDRCAATPTCPSAGRGCRAGACGL
jgi:putative FmdB family regulatory protein